MEPTTTTTEFWSSDNDGDEVDMLIQRILYRFHEVIFYCNFFLGFTLTICAIFLVIGLGFLIFVSSKIGHALDVTAMEERADREKKLKKKMRRERKNR